MFFHVNNLLYWNMYLPVINCILNAMCMNHLKFTKDREFEWQILLNLAVILACFASVFRILANRQSAQRSRVRKLQYISELERSVTTLQVIHQFNSLSKKKTKRKGKKTTATEQNSLKNAFVIWNSECLADCYCRWRCQHCHLVWPSLIISGRCSPSATAISSKESPPSHKTRSSKMVPNLPIHLLHRIFTIAVTAIVNVLSYSFQTNLRNLFMIAF